MTLSLVVPVRDDAENLGRLARQAEATGLFHELVIGDDASEVPVTAEALDLPAGARLSVKVLRSDVPRGAGHARNRALEAAMGQRVLFFDSDDVLRPELAEILDGLDGAEFDVCMFSFRVTEMTLAGRPGPYRVDAARWLEAEAPARPAPMTARQRRVLCRVSNYPWNKIYRRGYLMDQGIRCTEIPVHNDVELHWLSFLRTDDVWVSSLPGADHVTAPAGTRLTNRRGAERLEVMPALVRIAQEAVASARGRRYLASYAAFVGDLVRWIRSNLDEEHHTALDAAVAQAMATAFPAAVHALVALENPQAARRLTEALE